MIVSEAFTINVLLALALDLASVIKVMLQIVATLKIVIYDRN
jgi:hypothetical protein